MAEKVLMKGNEALAESALRAGCRFFFGYPITPQTELAAYRAQVNARARENYAKRRASAKSSDSN